MTKNSNKIKINIIKIINNLTLTDFLDPFLKSFIAFLNFILKLLLCPTVVLKSSNLGFIFIGTVDLPFDAS